jgi:YggT family protein
VQYLREVLTYVLTIYLVVLIGRMIFSWVQVFARDWRPSGILLVIAEGIFTITDPPLKAPAPLHPDLQARHGGPGPQLHGSVHRDSDPA